MALTIASFASVCGQPVELVALRAALNVRQMLPEAFVVNFIFFGMQTKPAPSPFDCSVCDSVWLRRGRVAVCATGFAGRREGGGFILPFWPCFFMRTLKYAWTRGVCLRTAVGLFFVSRPAKARWPRCQNRRHRRPQGWIREARSASQRSRLPRLAVGAAAQLRRAEH